MCMYVLEHRRLCGVSGWVRDYLSMCRAGLTGVWWCVRVCTRVCDWEWGSRRAQAPVRLCGEDREGVNRVGAAGAMHTWRVRVRVYVA